jgi:tetratricopeptide (TPR) repeat protein
VRFVDHAGLWPVRCILLWALLLLAGCAGDPRPPREPALREQALEAETDGALRYTRGDYSGAARHFAEAARLQQSLDNVTAAARNQLNQAHAELALGQSEAALILAGNVRDGTLQVQALQVQVQANLALGRFDPANELLARMEKLCGFDCPQRGSMLVLRARIALTDGNAKKALADAESALPVFKEQQEERETANAWRLIGTAKLALGELPAALTAAQTALDIDRRLALPEKIARDWILIGDTQRRVGRADDATSAYQRAQAVARAAGLEDIVKLTSDAIVEKPQ